MSALSDRSWTLVPMPVCFDVPLLRGMDITKCSAITHSLAAFYGYIPSLMYAVCVQSEESPSMKFSMVVRGSSNDSALLLDFVLAMISGIPFVFFSGSSVSHLLWVTSTPRASA